MPNAAVRPARGARQRLTSDPDETNATATAANNADGRKTSLLRPAMAIRKKAAASRQREGALELFTVPLIRKAPKVEIDPQTNPFDRRMLLKDTELRKNATIRPTTFRCGRPQSRATHQTL